MKRRGFLGALIGAPAAVIAAEKVAAQPVAPDRVPVIEYVPLHTTSDAPDRWGYASVAPGWIHPDDHRVQIDYNPSPFWKNRA